MTMKETTVKINSKYVNRMKSGNPIVLKEAIINIKDLHTEGMILKVVDERGQFIGKGYYGKQNKGYGWILTGKKNEDIDGVFFQQKILQAMEKRKAFFENEDTTAFRIFNGEGDGIGGVPIDYFD